MFAFRYIASSSPYWTAPHDRAVDLDRERVLVGHELVHLPRLEMTPPADEPRARRGSG